MKALKARTFLAITVLLIVIKSVIGFMMFHYENDKIVYKLSFKQDFGEQYSGDEMEIVRSAFYYNKFGKIMTDSPFHSFGRPRVRDAGLYVTAFRPKAQIMNHVFGLRLAESLSGKKMETIDDIPKKYLHYFGLIMCILKTLVFPFSILFFYKTLKILHLNAFMIQLGTWAYILIPSVFIFIGWFDTWENVALYFFLINFYFVLGEVRKVELPNARYYIMPLLTAISALTRPHLLMFYAAIYGFLFCITLFRAFRNKLNYLQTVSKTAIISLLFLFAVHIPIFIQNKEYFGKYTLSTQSKFEFFQGHNPFARGSWYPAVYMNNKAYFDSVFLQNPIPYNASELTEADAYQHVALSWIKHNPLMEAELIARKVAGYFLPWNFINHRINIYSILLHLAFFAFCIHFLQTTFVRGKSKEWPTEAMILLPEAISILLTVMFFTGERWRYFGEPFFLLMLLLLLNNYLEKKRKLKVVDNENSDKNETE
jgi:hypothetical protein